MFCLGRGSTPRNELYGIIDRSIDPDLGMYKLIGMHKVSTLDLQMCMIPSCHCLEHWLLLYDEEMQIPSSSYKLFIMLTSWSYVRNILMMFCLGRGSTPRDKLYGIIDRLIDIDLGLYEPIGIHEVSTLNLLSVHDPFVSLFRPLITSLWWGGTDSFKFLQIVH
jgi:hypothetical protein